MKEYIRCGKGFTKSNLYSFYSFYKTYPEIVIVDYVVLLQVNGEKAHGQV